MLDHVLVAIRDIRPHMTLPARAVLEAIILGKGSIGSADEVAILLGLKNRFRLARLLRRERLPPLHRLTEWIALLGWIDAAERNNVSLCSMAFHSDRDPSTCYRLVKRLTGRGWEKVQAKGGAWVLQRFLHELNRL
jgi:hypothetical protein